MNKKDLIAYRHYLIGKIDIHSDEMKDAALQIDDPDFPDAEKDLLKSARQYRDAAADHLATISNNGEKCELGVNGGVLLSVMKALTESTRVDSAQHKSVSPGYLQRTLGLDYITAACAIQVLIKSDPYLEGEKPWELSLTG